MILIQQQFYRQMLTKRQQPLKDISYQCNQTRNCDINQVNKSENKQLQNRFGFDLLTQKTQHSKIDLSYFRKVFTRLCKNSQRLSKISIKTRNNLCQVLWKISLQTQANSFRKIDLRETFIGSNQLNALLAFTVQSIQKDLHLDQQTNELVFLTNKHKLFNGINPQQIKLLTNAIFKSNQDIIRSYASKDRNTSKSLLNQQADSNNDINLEQNVKYGSLIGKSKKLNLNDLQFSIKIKVNSKQQHVNVFKGDSVETVLKRFFKSGKTLNDYELRNQIQKMIEQLGIDP